MTGEIESTCARQEMANSITHAIGLLLSVVGLPVLVVMAVRSGTAWHVVGCTVFGSALVLLYATSTLYHAFRTPRLKRLFQIFDHSAIYLLIAGTYTPFLLVNLRGPWGWTLFGIVWGLAVVGIVFTATALDIFKYISPTLYVVMGWLVIVAIKPLMSHLPTTGVVYLFCGGIAYTVGVVFFAWDRLRYNHVIWHCFVIAGSVFHYLAVVVAVVPHQFRS